MIAEGPSANRPPHIALEPLLLSSRSLKIAVLGCALLIGGCDRETKAPAQPAASPAGGELSGTIDRSRKGSELPNFTLRDASGKQVELASFKGKPLLINLWATWCAPCVAELPTLNALAKERDGSLKVLTISQDLPPADKVAPFLKARGADRLEPWLDLDGELTVQYRITVLPTTIYYDANGREVWRFVGGHDWSNAETAKMLAEAGG
jgi:thiol-disulfide isomerase/thioredoxin